LNDTISGGTGSPTRCRRRAPATVIAMCLLSIAALALSGCASGRAQPHVQDTYGTIPTFLPTSSIHPDAVLTGSPGRPALTSQGDSVQVVLADSSVRATVSGPVVPGEGLPYQSRATTCTWTVTLGGASKNVPITIADFSTLDHRGAVYRLALVAGQSVPPSVLTPGRAVTFELRTVMTTGEGLMRWAPGGRRIVASWDFEVEND
jgi:hypothetical protein